MRKLLIGSSALVAAGIVTTPVAFAGEAPKVSMSGATRLAYVIRDEDGPGTFDGNDGGAFQFANAGTEVRLDASGTADNGLTYGVNIDFRQPSGGVTVDEHYIFLEGGWGTLHLGGDDGVLDNMEKGGQSVQVGNWGFDVSQTILTSAGVEADIGAFASWAGITGDDAKIAYYTPSFGGFSAGVSIQPDANSITMPTGTGQFGNGANGAYGDTAQFEGAVNYDGSFGDVGVGLSFGAAYADGSDAGLEDKEALHAGATLSFGGFSVGAGIMDSGDTNVATGSGGDGQQYWSVGAAYSFGAGAVSTSYFNNEGDVEGDGIDSEIDIFTVDLQYTVAEGMTAFAQYYTAESTTGAGASVTSDVDAIVIGTTVTY